MAVDANGNHIPGSTYSTDPNNPDFMGPVSPQQKANQEQATSSVATPKPTGVPVGPSVPTPTPQPLAPSFSGADPNQSPAYLAFLRGAGLSEAQIKASIARQKAGLQSQLEAQRPVWAQSLEQALNNVLVNAAGRGTVRSGNRLNNQALAQQDIQGKQAAFEGNIASQQANLQDTLQEKLLELARQREESRLGAQQDVFSQQAKDYQNNLTNYYLQQLINGAQ